MCLKYAMLVTQIPLFPLPWKLSHWPSQVAFAVPLHQLAHQPHEASQPPTHPRPARARFQFPIVTGNPFDMQRFPSQPTSLLVSPRFPTLARANHH